MVSINTQKAKFKLTRLVDGLDRGSEQKLIMARNGKPLSKPMPLNIRPVGVRLGVADGAFVSPDSIDQRNPEVADLFLDRSAN